MTDKSSSAETQRIDKWLWYARFFKTRSLASKIVSGGKVRVSNGDKTERISKSSQLIRVGDTLTFPAGKRIRVVKVLAPGVRRGPASEAQTLYEEQIQPNPDGGDENQRHRPNSARIGRRPTKKQRRAMDQANRDTDW